MTRRRFIDERLHSLSYDASMVAAWVVSVVVLSVINLLPVTQTSCSFPKAWRGPWFEVDIGDIIIGPSNISRYGNCYHADRGYYLMDNRELDCQTCMLIEQRHQNVLQYQQSFCVRRDMMYKACLDLDSETVVHTLIREMNPLQQQFVPCPLRDAYHFSYVNNSGGLCAYPTSYMTPCAVTSRLRLHFKHCPDAAYAYERDLDIQCVATWNDGIDGYFVGRLASTRGDIFGHRHSRYRCFMYRSQGTVVYMSMSGDASCRGLVTPRDGPTVLEMTQDVFGWPKSQCTFPAWTTRNTWRDLTGRHVYAANDMGDVIEVRYRASLTASPEINKSFRCYRILARNTTSEFVTAITFVMFGCSAKYQCIKFVKRKEAVIEIHEGRYVERADEFCYDSDMLDSNKRMLLADSSTQSPLTSCPFQGQHFIRGADSYDRGGASTCPVYFRSGCNESNVLEVINECSPQSELQLECVRTWREHRKQYLVARSTTSVDLTVACYTFRKSQKVGWLEFYVEPTCDVTGSSTTSSSTSSSQADGLMFVMEQQSVECQTRSVARESADQWSSAVETQHDYREATDTGVNNRHTTGGEVERGGKHNKYGGRYRHVEKNDWLEDADELSGVCALRMKGRTFLCVILILLTSCVTFHIVFYP